MTPTHPYSSTYPRQYIAYRAPSQSDRRSSDGPAIAINGNLDKKFWNEVPWSEDFVDISTDVQPKFRTGVKMRWDDEWLYVAAMMEETDVWATLTEHNSVIFHDNDFEVFIDVDGTNHNYKEFEINALGTTWSLLLNKPYGDSGGENSKRVNPNGYDMEPPLQSAVQVYPANAINQPDVPNTHWTVEIAFPLSKLMERNPTAKKPDHGSMWRINFSRVQWGSKINDQGKYEKNPCCQSCSNPGDAAEDNWVWSKQGEVAMHLPERWGILQFSSKSPGDDDLKYYEEWPARCAAMSLYYALKAYREAEGKYTSDISTLKQYSRDPFRVANDAVMNIVLTTEGYRASATLSSYTAIVNEERHLIVSRTIGNPSKDIAM